MSFSDSSSSYHSSPRTEGVVRAREKESAPSTASCSLAVGHPREGRSARPVAQPHQEEDMDSARNSDPREHSITHAPFSERDEEEGQREEANGASEVPLLLSISPVATPRLFKVTPDSTMPDSVEEIPLPIDSTSVEGQTHRQRSPLRLSAEDKVGGSSSSSGGGGGGSACFRREETYNHLSPPAPVSGATLIATDPLPRYAWEEEADLSAHRSQDDTLASIVRLIVLPDDPLHLSSADRVDDASLQEVAALSSSHGLHHAPATPRTSSSEGHVNASNSEASLTDGREAVPSAHSVARDRTFLDDLEADAEHEPDAGGEDGGARPPSLAPDPSMLSAESPYRRRHASEGDRTDAVVAVSEERAFANRSLSRGERTGSWSPSPPREEPLVARKKREKNVGVASPSQAASTPRATSAQRVERERKEAVEALLEARRHRRRREGATSEKPDAAARGVVLSPRKDSPPAAAAKAVTSLSGSSPHTSVKSPRPPDKSVFFASRGRLASPRPLSRRSGTRSASRRPRSARPLSRHRSPVDHRQPTPAAATPARTAADGTPSLKTVLALRPSAVETALAARPRNTFQVLCTGEDVTPDEHLSPPVQFVRWSRPDARWTAKTDAADEPTPPQQRSARETVRKERADAPENSRLTSALALGTLSPSQRTLLSMSTASWNSRNASLLEEGSRLHGSHANHRPAASPRSPAPRGSRATVASRCEQQQVQAVATHRSPCHERAPGCRRCGLSPTVTHLDTRQAPAAAIRPVHASPLPRRTTSVPAKQQAQQQGRRVTPFKMSSSVANGPSPTQQRARDTDPQEVVRPPASPFRHRVSATSAIIHAERALPYAESTRSKRRAAAQLSSTSTSDLAELFLSHHSTKQKIQSEQDMTPPHTERRLRQRTGAIRSRVLTTTTPPHAELSPTPRSRTNSKAEASCSPRPMQATPSSDRTRKPLSVMPTVAVVVDASPSHITQPPTRERVRPCEGGVPTPPPRGRSRTRPPDVADAVAVAAPTTPAGRERAPTAVGMTGTTTLKAKSPDAVAGASGDRPSPVVFTASTASFERAKKALATAAALGKSFTNESMMASRASSASFSSSPSLSPVKAILMKADLPPQADHGTRV